MDKTDEPKPDLAALAQKFMDLWQQQTALTMADPMLTEAMSRWTAMVDSAGRTAAQKGAPDAETANTAPGAAGAKAAAAAPAERQPDLADLMRRLADCEKRIAQLESRAPRPRRKADGGAGGGAG